MNSRRKQSEIIRNLICRLFMKLGKLHRARISHIRIELDNLYLDRTEEVFTLLEWGQVEIPKSIRYSATRKSQIEIKLPLLDDRWLCVNKENLGLHWTLSDALFLRWVLKE